MELIKVFLIKEFIQPQKSLKNDINTSLSDLIKTNNETVNDLETKITNGATALSEIQKTITNHIKAITDTFTELNKKDTKLLKK